MTEPTPFADLNAVLEELVSGVRGLLGRNLAGFYLQGSFALGAGDDHSDLDFVAVTNVDLSDDQIPALEAIHAAIYDSPTPWAQHLEGSYIPLGVLRNLATAPKEVPGQPRPPDWTDPAVGGRTATVYPVWFLGNGARRLVRSEHDNSLVTRWILRERGIALAGPPASELIDPISVDALRYELRELMASVGGALRDSLVVLDQEWLQAFIVLLYTRMVCTVTTGEVRSKPDSVAWALANLAPEWHGLVERAWEVRGRQFRGAGAPERNNETLAEPREVARTLAFVRFASQEAGVR
jgi:hypothetical protein